MDLLQLMAFTSGISTRTLAPDTSAMGCAFDLKFSDQQPLLPNRMGEAGTAGRRAARCRTGPKASSGGFRDERTMPCPATAPASACPA